MRHGEETKAVTYKMPVTLLDKLEEIAGRLNMKKAELARRCFAHTLYALEHSLDYQMNDKIGEIMSAEFDWDLEEED